MDHDGVRPGMAQPPGRLLSPVVGAVARDDEHPAGAGVGLLAHDLAHQGHERGDPGRFRGGAEGTGLVYLASTSRMS